MGISPDSATMAASVLAPNLHARLFVCVCVSVHWVAGAQKWASVLAA